MVNNNSSDKQEAITENLESVESSESRPKGSYGKRPKANFISIIESRKLENRLGERPKTTFTGNFTGKVGSRPKSRHGERPKTTFTETIYPRPKSRRGERLEKNFVEKINEQRNASKDNDALLTH